VAGPVGQGQGRLRRSQDQLPLRDGGGRDVHGPRGRPAGPAADPFEPAGDLRPPRADRVRPANHRESTSLKQLGRTHELSVRDRHPGNDRIPVVYVTTPPKGSPRKLALEFARFLGLPPIRPSYNATDISDAVCQILIEARVDLVLVDEIHNLNLATSAGEDMSDHLKYFTEHLPATFVYAGINVERSGLFTGVRGRQIAGRCVLVNTGPLPYQQEWSALVATLEAALRLHHHRPGTLTALDKYLHQRTGGMIGSLSHLIRAAALTAVLDRTEAIDRELLDRIPVDHAAQSDESTAA